jgi:hypothetical protein
LIQFFKSVARLYISKIILDFSYQIMLLIYAYSREFSFCVKVRIIQLSSSLTAKIINQRCFKERGGGGEGNSLMVWIFSLSLKACTMEEIEGEELVYI